MAKSSGDTNKNELVELALAGIEAQIKDLTEKKEELKKLLGQRAAVAKKRAVKPKKAAARAATKDTASAKRKRVFTPATRKKLREAAKARWARRKESSSE